MDDIILYTFSGLSYPFGQGKGVAREAADNISASVKPKVLLACQRYIEVRSSYDFLAVRKALLQVKEELDVDLLALSNVQIPAKLHPDQSKFYIVPFNSFYRMVELKANLNLSANEVNKRLISLGLLAKNKHGFYRPTEKAEPLSYHVPAGDKWAVTIYWSEKVIPLIKNFEEEK